MSDWVYSYVGSETKEKVKIMCRVKGITQTKFVKDAVVDKLNKELTTRNFSVDNFFTCPKCEVEINLGDNKCYKCGQEIKWEDVTDEG